MSKHYKKGKLNLETKKKELKYYLKPYKFEMRKEVIFEIILTVDI